MLKKYIEFMLTVAETVLEKERELLATGYTKTERTYELLIDPGEYMLRLFDEFPVMGIT